MSQPQTEELEEIVRKAGLWDNYQLFIKTMEFTASVKYPDVDEEKVDAFLKTARYSYCAGVNDTLFTISQEIQEVGAVEVKSD